MQFKRKIEFGYLNNVRRIGTCLSLAASLILFSQTGQAGELISVPTRGDVKQSVYVDSSSATPPWVVVLFAGDDGDVALSDTGPTKKRGNFLVRTAPYWVSHGYAAVIFDTPSDYPDGMDDNFRLSEDAHKDLKSVVAEVHRLYPKAKVALIGTSRGTITVGNVLRRDPGLADAFVLTSPVTVAIRGKPGLSGIHWAENSARVLVVSNEHDVCDASPFWAAKTMAADNGFDFIAESSIQGGGDKHAECGGHAPHGFLGVESIALDAINDWLVKASAPAAN
jgi:hypothetical protein